MALGTFDANNQRLQKSTNLPTTMEAWSACGWGNRRTDPGTSAGARAPFIRLTGSPQTSNGSVAFDNNGPNWDFIVNGGNNVATIQATVAQDVWFFWAVVQDGSGTDTITGYYREPAATSFTSNTANGVSTTPTTMLMGGSTGANSFCGSDLANVKVWNAVLTEDELLAEMWSRAPVRWTDLNSWTPFLGETDGTDFSGTQDWTVTGDMTYQPEPPLFGFAFGMDRDIVAAAAAADVLQAQVWM